MGASFVKVNSEVVLEEAMPYKGTHAIACENQED